MKRFAVLIVLALAPVARADELAGLLVAEPGGGLAVVRFNGEAWESWEIRAPAPLRRELAGLVGRAVLLAGRFDPRRAVFRANDLLLSAEIPLPLPPGTGPGEL